jgi:hypothetical protein
MNKGTIVVPSFVRLFAIRDSRNPSLHYNGFAPVFPTIMARTLFFSFQTAS